MMVGPSRSGKSSSWRVLLKALERLEGVEGVAHVIDPKALTKEELYGVLDPNTREWRDGLFTHILRRIIDNVRGEINKRQVWPLTQFFSVSFFCKKSLICPSSGKHYSFPTNSLVSVSDP